MKKTVLITGGTGFLGKRLGLALKDEYNVVLAGRNNKQNLFAEYGQIGRNINCGCGFTGATFLVANRYYFSHCKL